MLTDPLRYDTQADLEMRLSRTIIRYKKVPVVVAGINGLQLNIQSLSRNPTELLVHSSDVDLDISSPPLGFVNGSTSTGYVSRSSAKKQKQGLSNDNCTIERFDGHNQDLRSFTYPQINSMLFNIYPDAQSVLKELKSRDISSRAFHRKYALGLLNGVIFLKYRSTMIGYYDEVMDRIVLNNTFCNSYTEKHLRECGLEVIL